MENLSTLEINLINKMAIKIFESCNSNTIALDEIQEALNQLNNINSNVEVSKYDLVSILDTIYYQYSVILSEIREQKRLILSGIFEQKPKLFSEKSVLEKKLDAEPEYAKYKEYEEYLFQFLEHINSIKNNIIWIVKESNS